MQPSMWHHIHLIVWTFLVLILGYYLGTTVLRIEEVNAPEEITVTAERERRRAPIVHVKEINDSKIIGVVGTGARLVMGEEVIIPKPDRSFEIPAKDFLVRVIDVPIPRDALFVASKRGKKYYDVNSSKGQKLVPENRLYFRSREEAEALGYAPSAQVTGY
jgi:hypothetical protein